ncbi:hypothetical protein K438DRAFT_2056135 [Mycena galopus ATCC 62051]|nr:hypothetical protein K438DRAFT_2056135 [Mycena galopus ATCC 62051]
MRGSATFLVLAIWFAQMVSGQEGHRNVRRNGDSGSGYNSGKESISKEANTNNYSDASYQPNNGAPDSSSYLKTSVGPLPTSTTPSPSTSCALSSFAQTYAIIPCNGIESIILESVASAQTNRPSSSTAVAAVLRHKLHPGALAGISVAVTMVLICLATMLFWLRRRRRTHGGEHSGMQISRAGATRSISPFTLIVPVSSPVHGSENATLGGDSDVGSLSISTPTSAGNPLATQLRVATEKIGDLGTWGRKEGGLGIRRILNWRLMSMRSAERATPEGETQLRQQIDGLMTRINALEANSTWGRTIGLADESPPEYASFANRVAK